MRGCGGGAEARAADRPHPAARALSTETRDLVGGDRREAAERVLERPALAPQDVDAGEGEGDPDSELEAEGGVRNA